MAKNKWMAGAVRHPGKLNATAERRGMSKAELCSTPAAHHQPLSRECTLWKTFDRNRPRGAAAHRAARKAVRTKSRKNELRSSARKAAMTRKQERGRR